MARSETVEKWLSDSNVKFDYREKINLSSVEPISIAMHQIRLHGLDREHVESLRMAYKAGEKLPPLALWSKSDNGARLGWIDGIHRGTMFMEESIPYWDAYIIQCDERVADVMRKTSNVRHGLNLSNEEKIEHAVDLIERGVMSVSEASRHLLIPEKTLGTKIRASKQQRELHKIGVTGRLNESQLIAISPVVRPQHRAELARLAILASLPADAIRLIAQKLKGIASDSEGDAILAEEKGRHADQIRETMGGKLKSTSPYLKVSRMIGKVNSYLDHDPKPGSLTKRELSVLIKDLKVARDNLDKTIARLQRYLRKIS
jgi:hypothetical protein